MSQWVIEPLADHHDRSAFDCGKPSLNDWIRRSVSQFQRKGLARTYILVRPGQPCCYGYYSISSQHINFSNLPPAKAKKLPNRLPLPVVLIGQLAVDRNVQGQGLGDALLIDALRRILSIAEQVGILAAIVRPLDDEARRYYLRKDFEPFQDDPDHMFLTLNDLRRAGLQPLGAEVPDSSAPGSP